MLNNDEFSSGDSPNPFYEERIPNMPYFMTNLTLKSKFDNIFITDSHLRTYIQMGHVGEYFLNWESVGIEDFKITIPAQASFDYGVAYRFPFGFTASFDVTNIFTKQVYDFFSFQRPTRAFWFRMGYEL